MSSNPYASPESDVNTLANTEVQNTSIWTKRGRLSVLSYWGRAILLTIVGYALIALVLVAGALLLGGGSIDQAFNPETMNPLVFIHAVIILLCMSWIGICQAIKRFHDLNLNGWWVLTLLIIVGAIALFIPSKGNPNRFGGWRQTKTWEKILGVIGLLLYALVLIGPFVGLGFLGGLAGLEGVS